MSNISLFEAIESLKGKYIKIWEDICNIESPSTDKTAVDRVGKYVSDIAKEHNWKVEVYPQERFGDVVCITLNPDAKGAPIALSGHMDTVHPIGLFGTPAVRIDGDRIYGPGVMDCKGGIVSGLLSMEALEMSGFKDRPVMLLLQSNEEIGSGINNKAPIRCICERAKDAIAFLNLEGYEGWFAGKACLVRKGIAGFIFRVYGIAAHASYSAREGASAIAEASHKILALEAIKNDEGITCSVGKIKGGTARNSIPAYCEFELDARFVKEEELEELKAKVQKIADETHIAGCRTEVELINLRSPMFLCDRNTELLALSNKAFEKYGLSPLECGFRSGGSDAADVTAFGIPCMDSMGVCGERAHSKDEYAIISSLFESAKRVTAIVSSI